MQKNSTSINSSDPTRDLAFDILCGVFEHRRMLETTLERSGLAPGRDRASAHRLAATVLRHYGSMSELLRPLLKKEPPVPVLCALLMGVAQLRYLETPPHAAVGTIVSLMRRRRLSPFAGLANAVLRRVAREGDQLAEGLDVDRLDVPPWLWSSWGSQARVIASGLFHEAPLDITCKRGVSPPSSSELDIGPSDDQLNGDDKGVGQIDAPKILPNGSARYRPGTRVGELKGFGQGDFWVQDAAASMPVRLMGDIRGQSVIDLCAAPGGKTAQLADLGANVTAVEREAPRMKRLQENMARLKFDVTCVQADAETWQPPEPVDIVLLDAPCSATGTSRRHPDVLWVKRPKDVTFLARQQRRLIEAAASMLKPGGLLFYVVCSLQDEEGPERVKEACERGWKLLPFSLEEVGEMAFARTQEGTFRTHPGMWLEKGGIDGFFVARLQRISPS